MHSGWIPDSYEAKDKPYQYKGSSWDDNAVPRVNLLKDNPDRLDKVYDQYSSNSCAAHGTAAAIRYLARKDKKHGTTENPSRLFIYYNARVIDSNNTSGKIDWPGSVKDDGTKLRSCLKAINSFGVAPEELWDFERNELLESIKHKAQVTKDQGVAAATGLYTTTVIRINDRPVDAAYETALKTHATEYFRLDEMFDPAKPASIAERQKISDTTKLRLRQCLVEGYPVVFGLTWLNGVAYDEHFEKPDPADANDEQYWSLKAPPAHKPPKVATDPDDKDGHVVLAIGFDDHKKRILCQNSWGEDTNVWKSDKATYNRYFWMPYAWVEDYEYTYDFWTIRYVDDQKTVPNNVGFQPTPLGLKNSFGIRRMTIPASPSRGNAEQIAVINNDLLGRHAFWISYDSAIMHSTPAGDGQSWNNQWLAKAGFAANDSAISALIVDGNGMQVFWISYDGHMGCVWCDLTNINWAAELPTSGKHVAGQILDGGLCSTVLADGRVAVFCVKKDGSIIMGARTGRPDNGMWDWAQLAPPNSACISPPSSIALLSRDQKSHLEIWWIGPNGSVESMHWHPGGWNSYQLAPDGSAALNTRISAAQWERPGNMGVFYIAPDGSLRAHYWDGNWISMKTFLGPSAGQIDLEDGTRTYEWGARVDSGLTVIAHDHKNTGFDVVWISPDNSLCTWNPMRNGGEPRAIAETNMVTPGTPLGAFYDPKTQKLNVLFTCNEMKEPLVVAADLS